MKTTIESSDAVAARTAQFPPELAKCANSMFEELQRYRDNAAGSARTAREARSSRLVAGIRQAASDIAASLRVQHPRFHASMVWHRIDKKKPAYYGLEAVPDLRTIRRALKQ